MRASDEYDVTVRHFCHEEDNAHWQITNFEFVHLVIFNCLDQHFKDEATPIQ
ncbi:hypothetical protein SAMN05443377_10670 [Propionibacterium cyclohexanicum]|jgi:hypothetical protein|uniref:Uncharacterized protein n=2 Tax=Actinomycetes TaxID=1760 RepID=A0A087DTU8_9BIFI|nr:hypothetical protein BISU_2149 [Bifidobacterium subtile]SER69398.1 hypothetical protein SAMN05443377_10670 [Propionibacterium cyclohexanicum]